MRTPSQTATPKNTYVHSKVSAVLLRGDIGGQFRGAKQRVKTTVDSAVFIDSDPVLRVRVVVTSIEFNHRHFVGRIAVDLVGAHENERTFPAEATRHLEEVQGPECIHLEVQKGNVAGSVVGRLGGAVDDQIKPRRFE